MRRIPTLLFTIPLSLGLCTAIPAFSASTSYPAKILTPEQAHADIDLMRRALETIHPGLYRYRTRIETDAAFGRLDRVSAHTLTDLDLWREVAEFLASIHCDHTKPEPSVAIDAYRESHATHLPLRFKFVEGRMIVVSNDGQAGAPPVGAEILSINGRLVPRIVTDLSKAVAYDGSTDQAIATKLAEDGDLTGDDLNEYWPAFYGFPERWTVEWKRIGTLQSTTVILQPISFAEWTALPWPGDRYRNEFYRAVTWQLHGTTAYLRIDTFVNYRNPVDATLFLDGFFRSLKTTAVQNLILDLRNNGGGSEDVSVALGRYLLPADFIWSKPVLLKAVRYGDLPSHIESWGDRKNLFEESLSDFRRTSDGWWERIPQPGNEDDGSALLQAVSPDRFQGRLTVLIGPRNGSGATRTAAQLKEKAHAILVGEDTGGSAEGPTAGHIFLLTLPNSGLKVRIPNAWNRTNIEHFMPGRGVTADNVVVETLADEQAGIDQVLNIAKAANVAPPPRLDQALAGNWSGMLDYRDFGNDKRVVLPTSAVASNDLGAVSFAFTYKDGPSKIVHDTDRWSLSTDEKSLIVNGDSYRVVEYVGGAAESDMTLVAEGSGKENDRDVIARIVVARRGGSLTLSRLTARPGEAFLMRDAYALTTEDTKEMNIPASP
ncbi:MAG TPA: S41 family peptidase [Rhizomicrobium sp.]|jgi:hypothetical protein